MLQGGTESRKSSLQWLQHRKTAIWTNLQTNHLWRRVLKNTIATTICAILAVTPAVVRVFGTAAYLAPVVTVFGHPGRRFGQMAEALVLAVVGALIGTAWSTLGIYLSSFLVLRNEYAAYTIKAIFLVISFMVHGFLRSHSPRLFLGVVIEVIVSVVSLTGATRFVSTTLITTLLYPILSAVGVLLLVNAVVFPEFSSSFLGITTIETLEETATALREAGRYFVLTSDSDLGATDLTNTASERSSSTTIPLQQEDPKLKRHKLWHQPLQHLRSRPKTQPTLKDQKTPRSITRLPDLTAKKAKLRTKLASCKAAQQECTFELAYAVLPPKDLKEISDIAMKKFVSNVISVIAACESKYALMGDVLEHKQVKPNAEREQSTGDRDVEKSTGAPQHSKPSHASNNHNKSFAQRLLRAPGNLHIRSQKSESKQASRPGSNENLKQEKDYIKLVKPQREIESGNVKLLRHLLFHISSSVGGLQTILDRSVATVCSCLAYCYDVEKLPSGALPPAGIRLEEIDIHVDELIDAISTFDGTSGAALEKAAVLQMKLDESELDIMPRMETFLISSFLLNLRQAASHALEMLKHCRIIVEKRQSRHGRRILHLPNINFRKWLSSGDTEDGFAMPEAGKKTARRGGVNDEENLNEKMSSQETLVNTSSSTREPPNLQSNEVQGHHSQSGPKRSGKYSIPWLRIVLADTIDYVLESEDIFYAIKLTIAAFLVCFPAFVPSLNEFFRLNRALWACLQLVLVFEVALGVSVWTFILRAVGTSIGCLWGYAAYEAGSGNRIILMVILVIGIIPSAYVQLGSQYIKAGMVSIISMVIVAIGTLEPSVPGTSTETFLRRLIAFFIGGVVALAVEVLLFPTRARDRLVESVATSVKQISEMEACLAYGIESEANFTDVQSLKVLKRFDAARGKAQTALTAAETFLPACAHEPRLKGSFAGHALIYAEILYVLHAIVDRMDGMHHLRFAYGSGVLEEFNTQIFPYRRNVAGSITLILFAVHEALITRLPLPQFLPSARIAHLRLVNRVREVVAQRNPRNIGDTPEINHDHHPEIAMVRKIFHKKFLAWNAVAAGHIEVIEYLEELADLVKLLVGADEFQGGLFSRSTHHRYMSPSVPSNDREGLYDSKETNESQDRDRDEQEEGRDVVLEPQEIQRKGKPRRRTLSNTLTQLSSSEGGLKKVGSQSSATEEVLPRSLQRVRSRRIEEMNLQRSRSGDDKGKSVAR